MKTFTDEQLFKAAVRLFTWKNSEYLCYLHPAGAHGNFCAREAGVLCRELVRRGASYSQTLYDQVEKHSRC